MHTVSRYNEKKKKTQIFCRATDTIILVVQQIVQNSNPILQLPKWYTNTTNYYLEFHSLDTIHIDNLEAFLKYSK